MYDSLQIFLKDIKKIVLRFYDGEVITGRHHSTNIEYKIRSDYTQLCAHKTSLSQDKISQFVLQQQRSLRSFLRSPREKKEIKFSISNAKEKPLPDLIVAGGCKIRMLFLDDAKVITFDRSEKGEQSSVFDALLRKKYSDLPAPQVFSIEDDCIIEELIFRDYRLSKNIASPKLVLKALDNMLPSYLNHANASNRSMIPNSDEFINLSGGHDMPEIVMMSVCHGQLYKADHLFDMGDRGIKLVDWSEGGFKDQNGMSLIYFDVLSSLKWTIFMQSRLKKSFYFFVYLNRYVEIIKKIKTVFPEEADWQSNFSFTFSCCFNKRNKIMDRLLQKILLYNISCL